MLENLIISTIQNEIKSRYDRDIQVKVTDHLVDDLALDSLDQIEMLLELEDKTGIDFDQSSAEKLQTVQDVVNLVEKYKNG